MKSISIIIIAIFGLMFSACSTKRVFEPKFVSGDWENIGGNKERVVDISADAALLGNRKVLLKADEMVDVEIKKDYRLLGSSDNWVLSSNIDGELEIVSITDKPEEKSIKKKFSLKKTIAAASIKGDLLAVLFADNEMAIYSLESKKLIVQIQGSPAVVVDDKITNPFFMNELVLFLTLDGKIVVVNSKTKKKLRTIIVSSEDNFNNVISFKLLDNKLIAATGYKLISVSAKESRAAYEIRNIIYSKNIYITTKQGEIISLTPDLQLNEVVKFPFAHFLGLIAYRDKIYALEKEGYLIELSRDLSTYDIYEVDVDDGHIFVANKTFYINDKYISVEQ